MWVLHLSGSSNAHTQLLGVDIALVWFKHQAAPACDVVQVTVGGSGAFLLWRDPSEVVQIPDCKMSPLPHQVNHIHCGVAESE